jgi:hypothetical protein
MYTDLALKLKALTLAVMINGLIMGGAAFLFDGQLHSAGTDRFVDTATPHAHMVHASFFQP